MHEPGGFLALWRRKGRAHGGALAFRLTSHLICSHIQLPNYGAFSSFSIRSEPTLPDSAHAVSRVSPHHPMTLPCQ